MFTFKDIGGVPSNPPAGYVGLYCNGGVLYWIDESGTTTSIASGTGDLLANGSVPLTANWDVGAFKITALQLESDVTTGTAPLIVASETLVTNLNADKVDGADLIDEDNMASDSDVHVPTQQSVKAYVDAAVVGLFDDKGNYDADTNTPDLDTSPSGILKGDVYTVSVAGTFFTAAVEVGDVLRALQDNPTALAHWAIVQTNLDAPSVKTLYESNSDTNALTDARAAAVDAAIVDGDFSGSNGFMRKTGAGTYEVVKANMAATAAPTADDDSGDGYAVGSTWWDTTNDEVYLCIDATLTAAVWKQVGSGSGGGVSASFKTGAYTAVAGDIVGVGSDTAAITITLPASPATDAYVAVWDADDNAGTNNITVARNGETIDGAAEDFVINIDGGRVDLIYNGTTWKVAYSTPGAAGFTGLKEIWIPAKLIDPSPSNPAGCAAYAVAAMTAWQPKLGYLAFDGAALEGAFFNLTLPKSWDGGDITAQIYWCPSDANTGNVYWQLNAVACGDGDLLDTTFGSNIDLIDAANGTQYDLHVSAQATMALPGTPQAGDMLQFLVKRQGANASDTYDAHDAYLLGVKIRYTVDAPTDD